MHELKGNLQPFQGWVCLFRPRDMPRRCCNASSKLPPCCFYPAQARLAGLRCRSLAVPRWPREYLELANRDQAIADEGWAETRSSPQPPASRRRHPWMFLSEAEALGVGTRAPPSYSRSGHRTSASTSEYGQFDYHGVAGWHLFGTISVSTLR